jgi:NAD(P)-dependent dehydrogenase (short-subunit alcohol dehydrogenase family)
MPVDGSPKAVLVTGASRGLGEATALHLAAAGFRVWAGVRSEQAAARLAILARERSLVLETICLDVTDKTSVNSAFEVIEKREGHLFGLVNNAGVTGRAFFEDFPEQRIRHIFEVNLFGVMSVTRRALPLMRANGSGRIIMISSIAGRIGSNSVSPYVASKFALEGFSESLSIEMKPFEIDVVIIEPGIVKTEIWNEERRILPEARDPSSPYYEYFWSMEKQAEKLLDSSSLTPADVAAKAVEVMRLSRPKLRYVVGRRASLVVSLRKYLPGELFERGYFGEIVRRMKKGNSGAAASSAMQSGTPLQR